MDHKLRLSMTKKKKRGGIRINYQCQKLASGEAFLELNGEALLTLQTGFESSSLYRISPAPKLQNKPAFLGRLNVEYRNQRVKRNNKAEKQKEAAEYINPRRSYVGKDSCL